MELVSASKLGKTQETMKRAKPYANKMLEVIGNLANAQSEYRHAFLEKRDNPKVIGVILVTTDRGLCGGLNINLLKRVIKFAQEQETKGIKVHFSIFGNKGIHFFKRLKSTVLSEAAKLSDAPKITDLLGVIQSMIQAYENKQVDQVYLASNTFGNMMTQSPFINPLLPLPKLEQPTQTHQWDYLYEPDAARVIDLLLHRYIESQVYQAVVENIACEQASRMMAMKNATDNAEEIIDDLKLMFNKARQAAITQELAEIVAGSNAV